MEPKKLERHYLRTNPIKELETYQKKEIGLGIAMVKFEEFQHIFDSAHFSLRMGMKEDHIVYASDGRNELAQKNYRLYHLKHAILDYNACYDYILQIVYFGYDFFKELTSKQDYAQELKKCNWNTSSIFRKEIESIISKTEEKPLIDIQNFYNTRDHKDFPLADWANQLKHRGGFDIDNQEENAIKEKLVENHFKIEIWNEKTGDTVFSSDYIKPIQVSFKDIESCLVYHNDKIVEYVESLYTSLGLEDSVNLKKKFSSNPQRIDTTDCVIKLTV